VDVRGSRGGVGLHLVEGHSCCWSILPAIGPVEEVFPRPRVPCARLEHALGMRRWARIGAAFGSITSGMRDASSGLRLPSFDPISANPL